MKKKILVACLCVALAVLTIAGTTLAYLTSKDEVVNTFTVGNVQIKLDEAAANPDGTLVYEEDSETPVARVKANSYKLIPGQTYTKDPTVHVTAGSEKCYVFVKVENGIAALEANSNTIASQIAANNWTLVTGETNVYYKTVDAATAGTDLIVFSNFTLANDANSKDEWDSQNIKVVVTAYAVQYDGFESNVAGAWTAAKSASGN